METKEKSQGKLKGLVSKLFSPLVLATGLTFSLSPNFSYADHKNDQKNLRDWCIINQGIRTMLDGLRDFDEHQFREWIKKNHESYYRVNPRNNREELDPGLIPQTFVANYWKDFDGDGHHHINEFVGLNKSKFRDNESLQFGLYLPIRNIKGKSYEMKVFNPNGKLIKKDSGFFEKGMIVEWVGLDIKNILQAHGEGTYSVAFYFNDGHWNTREFELIRDRNFLNRGTRREITIAEPIDVFIYRPNAINGEPKFEFKEDTLIDKLKLHSDDGTFYYFDDGEQHPDFPHQYVSVDKERRKLSIGCPSGLHAMSVEFLPGNPIIDINKDQHLYIASKGANYSKGRDSPSDFNAQGHLSIYNKDKVEIIPHFISNGSYKIVNGGKVLGWGPSLKNPVWYDNEDSIGRKMVSLLVTTENPIGEPIEKNNVFLYDGYNSKHRVLQNPDNIRNLSRELWGR